MRASTSVLCACVLVVSLGTRSLAQSSTPQPAGPTPPATEKVLGIGGLFFRAEDPKALSAWYERHLGINPVPRSYDVEPWKQEAGWTVFSPFPADSKAFGRPTQQWMINFRVRSVDAMAAQLKGAGIKVEVDPQTYPNGRFALLHDPEGNPIQLWEPKLPPAAKPPGS